MQQSVTAAGRASVGHPVDVASGVVFTAWADFEFPGPWAVEWLRFYATSNLAPTPHGVGWRSPYFALVRENLPAVVFVHEDGEAVFMPDPLTGAMVNQPHRQELFRDGPRYRIWDWGRRLTYHLARPPGAADWRLEEIVNRTGERTLLEYDRGGRLVALNQPPVRRIELQYTAAGGLIDRVELVEPGRPPAVLVRYQYDRRARLVAALDPAGAAIRYQYDDKDRLVGEANRLGFTFLFTYDDQDRCVYTTGTSGYGERHLSYDAAARRTRVRDGRGAEWVYDLNPAGQVVREQNPVGAVVRSTFTPAGRLALREFPNGTFLRLGYDADGHLATVTDGAGRTNAYEYGPLHLAVRRVNPDGTARSWEYDALGNQTAEVDEAGSRWVFHRDAQGRLTAAVTPNGHRTDVRYDPAGRWHELHDPFGWLRFEFDGRGQLVRVTDPVGLVEERRYDDRGYLTAFVNPDGSAFRFDYDADGNVTRQTDEGGRATEYRRTPLGAVVETIHPDGSRLRTTVDQEGRVTALVNENGERAAFRLNAVGAMVEQTLFDGRTERYDHDPAGQVIRVHKPDGQVIEYDRDPVGRTTAIRSAGRVLAAFEYDPRGRMVKAETPDAVVTFAFSPVGLVVAEAQPAGTVESGFDPEGSLVRQHLAGGPGGPLAFEYDLRRRLIAVRQGEQVLQRFQYDAADRLIRRELGGGAEERREYDANRKLREQTVLGPTGGTLARRRYTFSPAYALTEIADPAGPTAFRYDARDRLVARLAPAGQTDRMAYDPAGNLTDLNGQPVRTAGNRLLAVGRRTFRYDPNGLPTEVTDGTVRVGFAHDPLERLVRVELPTGQTAEYGYDGLARRVRKTLADGPTGFVWAGHDLRAERRPDGTTTEFLNLRYNPIAHCADGMWHAVVVDARYLPHEVLAPAGVVVWAAGYDGFGQLERQTGPGPTSPFRLLGQYADAETGLHYNRFRFYDPADGRFLQPDPIGLYGGPNEYFYAENPVGFQDPLGLRCRLVHFKVVMNPKIGTKQDYIDKRNAFNAARKDPDARIPTKADYDANIRPAANREAAAARAAGGYNSSVDADHPGDVRATGLLGQDLYPLDSGVNRSVGSQVGSQIRNNPGDYPSGQRTPMMDLYDQNGNLVR